MADPRRDPSPSNANEALFDATLRHQVGLRRFAAGEVRQVLDLLEDADRDLVRQLRERLGSVRSVPVDFTSARLKALLADVRVARRESLSLVRNRLSPDLRELARDEAAFESRMIQGSMPISVDLASVDAASLSAIVTTQPFNGRNLGDWYTSLEASDRAGLMRAIKLGLAQGETIDQMIRRIAGTRSRGFSDGALSITRRNAATVVRTAVNGVSNAARDQFWQANSDIISALRWTSTLDGRTSAVCRGRDGHFAPVIPGGELPEGLVALNPPGARPPAHPGCRSVMVAVVDGIGLVGRRPSVVDTRTRQQREINFRAQARRERRPIQDVRREWAEANIGSVPAEVTYDKWLRRQPRAFQEDVLGVEKAKIFRGGKTLDAFVDERGREFTLAELRRAA